MHDLFTQLFRDMAEAPRLAREIAERTARELGVCSVCGRSLEAGPCRARECPAVKTETEAR